jgi:aminoglycoside phosphotransferase family enzyme
VPVSFLQSPDAWRVLGIDGDRVEVVQTRRSWVFLAGDRVLKLKKPVRERLLDFSTPALRAQACREELRVNRRLAPGVYLGLVALHHTATGWRLDPEGRNGADDWAVLMRRLPRQRMLDHLLATGAAGPAQAAALARRLAAFWRAAPRAPAHAAGLPARLEQELQLSLELLCDPRWALPDARPVLQRCARALRAGAPRVAQRVAAARIVEGHGDLRPEHVCLPKRPAPRGAWPTRPLVIDALEFDPALRAVDPFDELAYLALECRRLGAPGFGLRVLARCARLLGDHPPHALLRVYTGHRALLRARLAVSHLLEPAVREPARWRPLAAWYLRCAEAALRPLAPPAP